MKQYVYKSIKFVCNWCGGAKIITDLEWQSFKFAGLPACCHRPMTREART